MNYSLISEYTTWSPYTSSFCIWSRWRHKFSPKIYNNKWVQTEFVSYFQSKAFVIIHAVRALWAVTYKVQFSNYPKSLLPNPMTLYVDAQEILWYYYVMSSSTFPGGSHETQAHNHLQKIQDRLPLKLGYYFGGHESCKCVQTQTTQSGHLLIL